MESTQVEVPNPNSKSVQPVIPILPVKMVVVATQTTSHLYKMLTKMQLDIADLKQALCPSKTVQSSPTPLPTEEILFDSELTVSILNTDNDCS